MREQNAFYYRGLCYFFLGDPDNAILNFRSYINSESNSAEAYFDLALCFKQKENDFEAINYLSMAIELNPKYEVAYLERGLLKHKMNDIEGGCADLKKSFNLGYLGAYYYLNERCKKKES
jgi:tetratricopeptide (TPR) repeat protein